jgi:hypothetical protein
MKDNFETAMQIISFVVGMCGGALIDNFTHRNDETIIKTKIGEFMIRDQKVYGVYEIQRNAQGDMVVR